MGDALHYEVPEVEPIEIHLGSEVFFVRPIGATTWRRFVKMMVATDVKHADPAEQARLQMRQEVDHADQLFSILERHMEPAEYERLERFSEQHSLSIETMAQVIRDCVEASSNRPTQPPSPSRDGRSTTGDGSTDDASSPESISTDSPSTAG